MTPVAFSVTEVRVAATCPRISYFDFEFTRRQHLKNRSVTRIWKTGADDTACGSLFHTAVEASIGKPWRPQRFVPRWKVSLSQGLSSEDYASS